MYHAICATFNFIPEPLYQLLQTVDCTEPIFICPNTEIWHEPAVHNTFDEQISNTVLITTSDGKIRSVEVNPSLQKVETFNEHTKIAEEAAREFESESESEAPIRKTHKSTSRGGANKLPPRKPNATKKQKRKSDKNDSDSDSDSDEMETKTNSGRVAKKRKTRDAAAKANAQILSKATPKSPSKKGSDSNGNTSNVALAAATSASKKSTIETKEAKKSNEARVIGEKNKQQKKNDLSKPNDKAKKGSKGKESSTSKAAASAFSSATKKNTTKEAKLNEVGGREKKKKAASKPKNKDASNSKIKAVDKAEGKEVAKTEAPQKVGDKVGGRKRSQSVATEDGAAASGSTTKKAKSTKKKKKKNVDPNMPKRPLTVYMLYCMEARPAAKKANPTAKVPQIGAILGKSWKALPQKDKERLQAKAQKLKDQYDLDKADYDKNNPPKDDNGGGDHENDGDTPPVSEGDADASVKTSTGNENENASSAKKKKRRKQQNDPNAPKRPLTSYMLFSKDVRHDIMKENPGAKVPEVGKITGQMYGKLSKERRQHYAQKAQELKDKYDVVKAEYAENKKIAGDDASKDPQDESEWY